MKQLQYVCYASLDALQDERFFEEKLKTVSEQRRAKVLRCSHKEDQIRSLGAGLLVLMACEELGITEDDLEYLPEAIERDMTDKYYCNISHAGKLAAVVISSLASGVDIETMARFSGEKGCNRMLSIVQKIGTETEKQNITMAYDAYNAAELWTRKEARAKAEGMGLGMDFATIDTTGDGFTSEYIKTEEKEEYVLSIFPSTNWLEIEECTMN